MGQGWPQPLFLDWCKVGDKKEESGNKNQFGCRERKGSLGLIELLGDIL